MGVSEIVKSVDREIALLKQVRALLSGPTGAAPRKPAGRPKKAMATSAAQTPAKKVARKKRRLTPEGRKRIAEAVKRRWETQRKAAAAASK